MKDASNMLFFYYTLHTYREILDESKKLYITSASFKNASNFDYLREKRKWVMLNNIRPMFYHLFSFTLFTDILVLNNYKKYQGIVGYIFVEIKAKTNIISFELLFALITTALLLYPVKCFLESFEQDFAKKHHIDSKY